jgi:hypothetical protein
MTDEFRKKSFQVYEQLMPVRISGDDHYAHLVPVYIINATDSEEALRIACKRTRNPVIGEVEQ